jgi:hypothetical protein
MWRSGVSVGVARAHGAAVRPWSFRLDKRLTLGDVARPLFSGRCLCGSERGVAQPGSALGSGPRSRRFKSSRPDSLLRHVIRWNRSRAALSAPSSSPRVPESLSTLQLQRERPLRYRGRRASLPEASCPQLPAHPSLWTAEGPRRAARRARLYPVRPARLAITAASSDASIGLGTCDWNPASSARVRSWALAYAVSAAAGMRPPCSGLCARRRRIRL